MKVPTECASLDNLLEGGIEPGVVTLLYGEPAAGKTNLCLQLSRTIVAQGLRVAYVDTEGVSFDRLRQISGDLYPQMIKKVLFATPDDLQEQTRRVEEAAGLEDIGLIVVDSLNHLYRLELDTDPSLAGRRLQRQLGALQKAARKGRFPVLVTAQVYEAGEGSLPFGGRTMGHIVKTVLELGRAEEGLRYAVIRKHRAIAEGRRALFRLTPEGLE
jgi:DNA repair protein RadB